MDERTLARFLSKVDKNGPLPPKHPELGPCWLWKPAPAAGGYCYFTVNGKPRLAHRVSCEHFNGEIPAGYDVDHLCEVRNCVRPSHLKARTHADNARRARAWEGGAAFQRDKTHCPYGHPYSGDNLRIAKDGKRVCKECARRYSREADERKRAANPPQPKPERTHCKNGHPYAEFGTIGSNGQRRCRACDRDSLRERRKRARVLADPKAKATCKHGHPWIESNIYVDPRGHKHCRACHNERSLARYYAARTERPPAPRRETCANGHPWAGDNLYVTPQGLEKCRECARERNRRYAARLKATLTP